VSEKGYIRTLRVYKPTPKGYKKIYTYSDSYYFLKASPETLENYHALNTYWETASARVYRVFECEPEKDKVRMTFEMGHKGTFDKIFMDNGDSFL
jgi:hypothetical protein